MVTKKRCRRLLVFSPSALLFFRHPAVAATLPPLPRAPLAHLTPMATARSVHMGIFRCDVKKLRNAIYRTSGWIIFLCIGLIVAEAIYTALTGKRFGGWVELNLTFWLEAVALWAFGATWLVKSRFHGRFLVDTPPD